MTRKLLFGRTVNESDRLTSLITTKCPEKWIHIDLENGNCWIITNDNRARSLTPIEKKEAINILKKRK